MRTMVAEIIKKCPICQPDRIKKTPIEEYHVTFRPNALFRAWAIDLAGPFPKDEDGCVYLIVAIDIFSKWTEA